MQSSLLIVFIRCNMHAKEIWFKILYYFPFLLRHTFISWIITVGIKLSPIICAIAVADKFSTLNTLCKNGTKITNARRQTPAFFAPATASTDSGRGGSTMEINLGKIKLYSVSTLQGSSDSLYAKDNTLSPFSEKIRFCLQIFSFSDSFQSSFVLYTTPPYRLVFRLSFI